MKPPINLNLNTKLFYYILLVLVLLMSAYTIGYYTNRAEEQKTVEESLDFQKKSTLGLVDGMVYGFDSMCIAELCINQQTTIGQIQQRYEKFRNQPIAEDLIYGTFTRMCRGSI